MNKQLEEFFAKQKSEKEKIKNEHLKKLGLYYDLEKSQLEEISESMAAYTRPDVLEKIDGKYFKKVNSEKLEISDEEFEKILEFCPMKDDKEEESFNTKKLLLEKVEAIRKMMKFFTVLTIISLSISILVCIIMLLSGM